MYSFIDFSTRKILYNYPHNLGTDGCTIQKFPEPLSGMYKHPPFIGKEKTLPWVSAFSHHPCA